MSGPAAWVALATLVTMEVVLGIDNLIFISILSNKLPEEHRARSRQLGIGLTLGLRLGLLASVAYIVQLTQPILTAFGSGFSWRDIILVTGGLFLAWKATREIHDNVDPHPNEDQYGTSRVTLGIDAGIGKSLRSILFFFH
jgi:predicted tellurium resistance membrane protein TerC